MGTYDESWNKRDARADVIAAYREDAARLLRWSQQNIKPAQAAYYRERSRMHTACADWLERNGDQEPR